MADTFSAPNASRIVRRKEALARVGVSEATAWRLSRAGQFPKARRIGVRAVGYLEDEITAWIASRQVA
jgi:prophage regulatory protein